MINSFKPCQRFQQQEGAATLILTVILMTLSVLIVILAGQSGILQEKISANTNRNYQALTAAEAGMEFGISYLKQNSAAILASPVSGYLAPYSNSSVTNVVLANNSSFSIVYTNPVASNYTLIKITSTGTSDDGSSTRVVSQLVKYGSLLDKAPTVSYTTRRDLTLGSSGQAINLENNNTLRAGQSVTISGSGKTVLSSGTSSTAGNIKSDVKQNVSSLDNMSRSDFFSSFFGLNQADMMGLVGQYYSSNGNSNFSSQLNGLSGTAIWIEQTSGTAFINGNTTIGLSGSPVILIINGPVSFSGSVTIYGFIYVIGSVTTSSFGTLVLYGSMASTNDVTLVGNALMNYSSSVLTALQQQGSLSYYAKVPGSWRDF